MIQKIIGMRIRNRRKQLGLSLAKVASRAGLAEQELRAMEKGTGELTGKTLMAVSRALGVSPVRFVQNDRREGG